MIKSLQCFIPMSVRCGLSDVLEVGNTACLLNTYLGSPRSFFFEDTFHRSIGTIDLFQLEPLLFLGSVIRMLRDIDYIGVASEDSSI